MKAIMLAVASFTKATAFRKKGRSEKEMERIKFSRLGVFAAVLLALVTLAGWPEAVAAAVSCNQILKNAKKTKTPPIVTHNVDWGIITMTSALGSCREPIEVWRARHITWIKVTKGTKAAAKITMPKITKPKITKPKTAKASAPVPPPAVEPARAAAEPCNQQLKNFWRQTAVSVRGQTYYLSQVFAIDQDNNGVTDNLGFNLKARGKPDMTIRYFASPGQISGRDLPGIGIDNDQLIARFCFGRVDFGAPPEDIATTSAAEESFKLPDLAKQMKRKKAGLPLDEPKPAPVEEKKKSFGLKFWIITVASSLLFIIVIAIIVIVTKPKWEHLLKHEGGDDEDDEDGEDEEGKK